MLVKNWGAQVGMKDKSDKIVYGSLCRVAFKLIYAECLYITCYSNHGLISVLLYRLLCRHTQT